MSKLRREDRCVRCDCGLLAPVHHNEYMADHHAFEQWEPLTADTITDEQIRELRRVTRSKLAGSKYEARSAALGIIETCDLALGVSVLQRNAAVHAYARARCVEILNERAKASP